MPIRIPTLTAVLLALGLLADTSTLLTSAPSAVEIAWEGTIATAEVVREAGAGAARAARDGIDAAATRWQVERAIADAQWLAATTAGHDLCPSAQVAKQPVSSLPWSGGELLRLRLDDLLRPW